MPRPLIQRGEIWIADLGYLGKVRPVLVVSIPPTDTERALFIVISHTTSLWKTQYEVPVVHPALETGAFDAQQIFLLPPVKFDRKLGALSAAQMTLIEAAIARILGLKLAAI